MSKVITFPHANQNKCPRDGLCREDLLAAIFVISKLCAQGEAMIEEENENLIAQVNALHIALRVMGDRLETDNGPRAA